MLDGTAAANGKIRAEMVNGEIRNLSGNRKVRTEKDMGKDMDRHMEKDTSNATIVEAMDTMQLSAKHR